MYIYEIANYWFNEKEQLDVYGFSHVIHEKKYSSEEFGVMCEKAREVLGKDTYDIADYLIKNYGFEKMSIEARFEYDVDEE